MQICQLCLEKEANKKNTHYLTNSVFRKCLNKDGVSIADKGFSFNVSTDNPFVEFGFQRGILPETLEESLGRELLEKDFKRAKKEYFSVDNIFCSTCEDIFTSIESYFTSGFMPKVNDLFKQEGVYKLGFDSFQIRYFVLLQFWRTNVCSNTIKLSNEVAEDLRISILNYPRPTKNFFNYPYTINYLVTTGEDIELTNNIVGFSSDRNPYQIFMCQFIFQFFESKDDITYLNFYGLYDISILECILNFQESHSVINILSDESRRMFLNQLSLQEKVIPSIKILTEHFKELWLFKFGKLPSYEIFQDYISEFLADEPNDILKYSKENMQDFTIKFIESKGP